MPKVFIQRSFFYELLHECAIKVMIKVSTNGCTALWEEIQKESENPKHILKSYDLPTKQSNSNLNQRNLKVKIQ